MDENEIKDWQDWAEAYETSMDEENGAGEEGTSELKDKYSKETPGQTSDVPTNSADWLKDAVEKGFLP